MDRLIGTTTYTWAALRNSPRALGSALRTATARQALVMSATAAAVGVIIGLATVLIPNDVFSRDVAPVMWNYPALAATALLSGLLAATYVRSGDSDDADRPAEHSGSAHPANRLGPVGVVITWFAVGCPVCNKLALVALGYSGALQWFAPVQPVLAVAGIALLWIALAIRLDGQRACRVPARGAAAAR
ncbi:hypothetical protein ABLE94_22570 [Gordonia sp. VNK1]|uniref:hypothetical protein n=1 Tax=Gordonia oleivorans TaxID=3156618 RepID=UPI0032B4E1E8